MRQQRTLKIANKKEAAFKRKYQESYLNDEFITEVIHILQAHFVEYVLTGYAVKPWNIKTASPHKDQAPCIKTQDFGVFQKKKKCEHEELKQLLKATTSSNVSAPRASFLVANCIAKTKKLFTIGEELILPAAMDICREL